MSNELISTNPAKNYEEIGRVNITTEAEVSSAVKAAHAAFPAWRDLGVAGRVPYFEKFLAAYQTRATQLAELQSQEMGKKIGESTGDVADGAEWLQNQLKHAERMLTTKVIDDLEDRTVKLHHEPFGVAAVIAPWNYPTDQWFMGVGQALLAGNAVVFKHSEECSLTSQLMDECMQEAGFPTGVFTTVYGAGEVGEYLVNQDINLIHFTGSSRVGEALYKKAAEKFIPCVLEMGGSSPGLVFEDVDIEEACDSVYAERFSNCGQVCTALKRLFVHESIFDEVVAGLKDRAEAQVLGDPLEEATTQGPLVAARIRDLLAEQVEDAKAKGVSVVAGGEIPAEPAGAYYLPTILTDVTKDMRVYQEETFGPVLTVMPFSTEAEAIELANDTEYGLSAYVYTKDTDRAERVAKAFQAGQVSVNGAFYLSPHAPFGGYKKSGLNRGSGLLGYRFVTQAKVVAKPK